MSERRNVSLTDEQGAVLLCFFVCVWALLLASASVVIGVNYGWLTTLMLVVPAGAALIVPSAVVMLLIIAVIALTAGSPDTSQQPSTYQAS